MAHITSESSGNDFEKPSTGLQQAVCFKLVDMGKQITVYDGNAKEQDKVCFVFELKQVNSDGERFLLKSREYTDTLDPRGNLRKDLESWRGRPFTKEELAGFDLESVVGANAMLNVILVDDKYTNISSFSPLIADMEKITPTATEVPEWIQKRANEGIARRNGTSATSNQELPAGGVQHDVKQSSNPDDDLPF